MPSWAPAAAAFSPDQVVTATLRARGAVQGVGFRPTVYRLARSFGLGGWVRNDREGVIIRAIGPWSGVQALVETLRREPPPAARLDKLDWLETSPGGTDSPFAIIDSPADPGPAEVAIPPDLAVCADCRAEILDPGGRRHDYDFTNCTNCGPRFTILERFPYDRANTTMRRFSMCADCAREYHDPADRRFHAQPIACPACGPRLQLLDGQGTTLAEGPAARHRAADALRDGAIVALKALGGFQLLTDARSATAVARLRQRKARPDKPLAVMFPDLPAVRDHCLIDAEEEGLLTSPAAPIVLLRRRPAGPRLPVGVGGAGPREGVMLPSTPLHVLLLRDLGFPVIATSGNRSEEPICIDESQARTCLGGIADLFLVHDRPIARPVDDSVAMVAAGRPLALRAARGFAPVTLPAPPADTGILAVGPQQKNTVGWCGPSAPTTAAAGTPGGGRLVLSQHVGDLGTKEALAGFTRTIGDLGSLFGWHPTSVACDLHPDYDSTRHAADMGLPVVRVPHHLAHALAAWADAGLTGPALAVVWDGAGLGTDGTIWGGEFLRVGGGGWRRMGHWRPFPLPGGEAAAREPRRVALALLHALPADPALAAARAMVAGLFPAGWPGHLETMIRRGVNCPATTSVGRLFDGVAALLGLGATVTFEGQAALALEALADSHPAASPDRVAPRAADHPAQVGPVVDPYPVPLDSCPDRPFQLDWRDLLRGILADRLAGRPAPEIAAAFHATLVAAIVAAARAAGERAVLLAGGCFQNAVLLEGAVQGLRAAGFEPHWPRRVPPNDGGLALGQLVAARDPELMKEDPHVPGCSR